MSHTEKKPNSDAPDGHSHNIPGKFSMKKDDLIAIAAGCQERNFSEEIDIVEKLGGEDVFKTGLQVDYDKGIDQADYDERIRQYGSNRKKEVPPKSIFALLWGALEDFTLRILLCSAAISIIANMIVEEDHRNIAWIEGFAIFMAVAVCASVTAINDYQKEAQFRKLQEFANAKKLVTVWRGGEEKEIHPNDLCCGDLIKINEGMDVPADIFILEAHEMTADESAMTGESDFIKKNVYSECLEKRNLIIEEGGKNTAGHYDVYSPVLLSGTKIQTGAGKGLVLVVGADSCVGRIQSFLDQEAEATPLQQKLETIAKDIGKFGLISAVIILIILIIRFLADRGSTSTWGEGSKYLELIGYFIIAITVVVVAIPEGLPLSVTLSLAYSVKKMLIDKNLVRKLQATETMGGANAICSDKTGTLTQNKMTLTTFWNGKEIPIESYQKGNLQELFPKDNHRDIIMQALGCNGTATLKSKDGGSKTEIALLEFLERFQVSYEELRSKHVPKSAKIFPFTSARKRMSVVCENIENGLPSKKRMHIKGASEIVLASCDRFYNFVEDKIVPLNEDGRANIEKTIEHLANQALRTICIGYKEFEGNEDLTKKDDKGVLEAEMKGFILCGVLGIRDILRKEVKDAVKKCKAAGIKVRMVTGDNKITAAAIARECGIIDPQSGEESIVLEGPEFIEKVGGIVCKNCRLAKDCKCPRTKEDAKKQNKEIRVDTIANGEVFDKIYPKLDVLARSRPDDKYALVTGLIERGMVIAVTGDGTNDAPALKKADVGFAMNSGTAVAKEASDIVLIDDNFASIIEAVKWGRNIYDNIKKFLQFQLTVNVVAVGITLMSAAVLREPVIKAVNMLWINLIMDTLASLALATEPPTEELLRRKPHDRNEYILSKAMMKHIIGQAIYQFIVLCILTFSADKWFPENLEHAWDSKYLTDPHYDENYGKYVRSGRAYYISDSSDDYERFLDNWGPSRHYTIIFNTFVWMQIFNFFNARKIRDEINIFQGVFDNRYFMFIVVIICGLQAIIIEVGNRALNCSEKGLSAAQWFICIGISSIAWIWSVLLKILPFHKLCPTLGNKLTDPLHADSGVLKMRRSKQDTLTRKYSSLNPGNKHGSLTKVQYHAVPQN